MKISIKYLVQAIALIAIMPYNQQLQAGSWEDIILKGATTKTSQDSVTDPLSGKTLLKQPKLNEPTKRSPLKSTTPIWERQLNNPRYEKAQPKTSESKPLPVKYWEEEENQASPASYTPTEVKPSAKANITNQTWKEQILEGTQEKSSQSIWESIWQSKPEQVDTPQRMSLKRLIPLLMIELDKDKIKKPIHLTYNQDNDGYHKIFTDSKQVDSGPIYEAFKTLKDQQALFKDYSLTLQESVDSWSADYANTGALATKSCIVLLSIFQQSHDAKKIFSLLHEMQHHLHGDQYSEVHKKAIFADLILSPEIQAILKFNNIDLTSLSIDSAEVQKEIDRYQEFRADHNALHAMQCPYCVEECQESKLDMHENEYQADGYLHGWQYDHRIKELKEQGTVCQHHYNNYFAVDCSHFHGSTLANRLKIVNLPNKQDNDPNFE